MYMIIWEYQVKVDHVADFETIYASNGAWAKLFSEGNDFISTELLRDEIHAQRYITIDRWDSVKDYEAFCAQHKEEYETLDSQCSVLTKHETLLGKWESVTHKTR